MVLRTLPKSVHLALLLLFSPTLFAANPGLPKIRVARDGRTFETSAGKPFVPFGVTYYRPDTGWAPQVWKQFDPEATRADFARMKTLGINCVRIFLTYHSFYHEPGKLDPLGIQKFDQFLQIAEQAGIYVHPTGPEFWEGPPDWRPVGIADRRTLEYTAQFWKAFAGRYRGRNVIFAYDLKNEPAIEWQNEAVAALWNDWLRRKYGTAATLATARAGTNTYELGKVPVPQPKDWLRSAELLDFQKFREDLAYDWTRMQVAAIKSADPDALVTVGFLQTTVPSRFWSGVGDYTGFRPSRQAELLDFLEIHFYPSERGGYEYKSEDDELANIAYLEGIVREMAKCGKPVVLGEFGWYGGEQKPKFDGGKHPLATEEQQAKYLRRVVQASAGFVVGWFNWGLYDCPGANDCSELSGLLTADGKTKEWGKTFQQLSAQYSGKRIPPANIGPRPDLDWDAALTSAESTRGFREKYRKAMDADQPRWD